MLDVHKNTVSDFGIIWIFFISLQRYMDNFVVSALKYRPDTFDTVVGQKSLVTTLRNAVKSGQISHAYLFCGPRGVGKTTTARILAKNINCLNPKENGDACGECESCKAFQEKRSLNIHELDAASNNSVDDIRGLIDKVRIPPQIGKYSVYIIDEVHMLSQSAFNAFLKTLEEPPSYAIFILATTEKNKVLPTIISRCQVFDFNRMSVDDIVGHLKDIASKEGIEAEEEALGVIAMKADGGMRDALSIFDRVVSFCGNKITYRNVIDDLNILDYNYYFKGIDFFLNQDISGALLMLDEILANGFDAHNFVLGLMEHVRNILVCKDVATASLLETGESVKKSYVEQAAKCQQEFLFNALEIINDCDISYRQSKSKRLTVELMLIRLCQLSEQKKN